MIYETSEELRNKHFKEIKTLQKRLDGLTEDYIRGIMSAYQYFTEREAIIIQLIELKVMIKEREKYERFFSKSN